MTTSKKKAAPRSGEKAKRSTSKAGGRTSKAQAAVISAPEAGETTPVVTTVTFAAEPEAAAPPVPPVAEAAPERPRPLMVYEFQQRLAERGFYPGLIDGEYGPFTRMAVAACQRAHGLPVDGEPTADTLQALGF
ncbi:MAG: peptidoglycan-binding domain-containing protein [Candidatus Sericytochromatia bacterium]|nr:peptidoglycan-binding domain-containing protein [Candidatus Sericytochromatia bacterium]